MHRPGGGKRLKQSQVCGQEPGGCVEPIELPGGETRSFLEDGDEVTLRGWCEAEGAVRIGFGECVGRVVAPG